MKLKLYDTLTKQLKEITTGDNNTVRIYNCGPTVYMRQHIGNLRAYIHWDVLHRSLEYLEYNVNRVMNITDVGHMSGDEDFGEDKVDKEASSRGVDPLDIANEFIRTVLIDYSLLNILSPSGKKIDPNMDLSEVKSYGWLRATDHIQEMIEMNKKMVENGYAYETDLALYFDVSKYDEYTRLSGQKLDEKLVAVRDEVVIDPDTRNPADFVLWMKRKGKYEHHLLHWNSPWGDGFPGWHIECSAMGGKYHNGVIDIHTGGVDHIGVHHSNERAQNFGAYEKNIVNHWVHNEFIVSKKGEKIGKSMGNSILIEELAEKGFDPLDYRYLVTSVSYRMPMSFSLEALKGAKNSRLKLIQRLRELNTGEEGKLLEEYIDRFKKVISNDLNMSEALAIIFELLKSSQQPSDIVSTILDMDRVLGLNLSEELNKSEDIPSGISTLLDARKKAREDNNYDDSDRLRDEILKLGYQVKDTSDGQEIIKV